MTKGMAMKLFVLLIMTCVVHLAVAQTSALDVPWIEDKVGGETQSPQNEEDSSAPLPPPPKMAKKVSVEKEISPQDDFTDVTADNLLAYKGQKEDMTQWKRLDHEEWLRVESWYQEVCDRSKAANWYARIRDLAHKEEVGRFISCVGKCLSMRDDGFSNSSYRTQILEGDEIETQDDSFASIVLMDGTMVRLSARTSVTFHEVDLGIEETFFFVRVNYGEVQWVTRSQNSFRPMNLSETDTIFYPLHLMDANPPLWKETFKEEDLATFSIPPNPVPAQYARLNELIEKNNPIFGTRRSYAFIVTPNVTIEGYDLKGRIFSSRGGISYFKFGTMGDVLDGETASTRIDLTLRGDPPEKRTLESDDVWYEIDGRGRTLKPSVKAPELFALSELLSKRVPTLMIGREMFVEKYFADIYRGKMEFKELARRSGHRLWATLKGSPCHDLSKRHQFLTDFTWHGENLILANFHFLRERLPLAQRWPLDYTPEHYRLALAKYLEALKTSTGVFEQARLRDEWNELNSARKEIVRRSFSAGNAYP
jgi:hypothetical protein